MKTKKNRGRPPKYVLDPQGRPVVGLSHDKANNRYFNTHYNKEGVKKENFGNGDYSLAIFEFMQWNAKKKGEQSVNVDAKDISNGVRTEPIEFEPPQWLIDMQPTEEMKRQHREQPILFRQIETRKIPESLIWQKARELILFDLPEARKRLNLPIRLDGPVKPLKSISLQEIGNLYFQHPRFHRMSQRYRWEAKRYWKEFCRLVKVKTIQDITIPTIDSYQEAIYRISKERKWAGGASVNNRFSVVKTIFKNATKRTKDVMQIPEIERVQGYLERLSYAPKAKVNPKPISRQNYLLMLKSEVKPVYRAILLLALNCGMKPSGIVAIKKKNINLEDKTLHMPRPKTGIIRVACLWDRTCEAIRELLGSVMNDSDYLFLNEAGRPLRRASINEWWMRRRRKLGIDQSVKFEHIRDATQTIPVENDPRCLDEVRLIMGHTVAGIANSYLERRPNMVRKACQVIEKYYFGNQ